MREVFDWLGHFQAKINQDNSTSSHTPNAIEKSDGESNRIFIQSITQSLKRLQPPRPSYTLRYGFALLVTLVLLLIILGLPQPMRNATATLFFILAIALSTRFGGFLSGIIATITASVGELYLFLSPEHPFISIIQVAFFCAVGSLISFLVSNATNNDEVERLRLSEKILAEKYSQEQGKLEKASKEIKARDEFLSIASHELKTPLTSMLLQLQVALHNIRTVSLANFSVGDLMNMLENTEKQVTRLAKMINDLLNISLITTGRLTLELYEMDLAESAKLVFESFAERLIQEHYQLDMSLDEDVIGVWDKIRIEQVITNLLSNAIKYGNHKPIVMKVFKDGDTAKLLIKDCGIGIAPETQKRIFARFDRGVQNGQIEGLGVGLYITNQIIQAHSGKITVHSKPNDGTTFIVELPISQSTSN